MPYRNNVNNLILVHSVYQLPALSSKELNIAEDYSFYRVYPNIIVFIISSVTDRFLIIEMKNL